MKEKLKRFMNSKPVKTIGVLVLVGVTAFAGAYMGTTKTLKGHPVDVHLEGYDVIKIEPEIEDSGEEA